MGTRILFGVGALALSVTVGVLGSGCKNCLDPPKVNPYGEPITTVRGVEQGQTGRDGGTRHRASSRSWRGLLVWPVARRSRSHVPFVYGYYSSDPADLMRAALILDEDPDREVRTCEPQWRLELFGGGGRTTVFLNLSCGLAKTGSHFLRLSPKAERRIRHWIVLARVRPTHKVVRIKVPVVVEPLKVVKALESKALLAFQSDPLAGRRPYARVSVTLQAGGVEDLTKLDETAGALRQRARALLSSLARAVVDSRPEAVGWSGPYPEEEDFSRGFRVRWGMTIFFRYGTDDLSIRYLLGGLDVDLEEVYVPTFYRLDVLVPSKTRLSQVRRMLKSLGLKEKLGLWLHRPKS